MYISPAQNGLAETLGSITAAPSTPSSASTQNAGRLAASTAPPPQSPSPFQISADLQIDSQHQVYYEFVDKVSGNVVYEIPPEALRAIAESLDLPFDALADFHNVDVSS